MPGQPSALPVWEPAQASHIWQFLCAATVLLNSENEPHMLNCMPETKSLPSVQKQSIPASRSPQHLIFSCTAQTTIPAWMAD